MSGQNCVALARRLTKTHKFLNKYKIREKYNWLRESSGDSRYILVMTDTWQLACLVQWDLNFDRPIRSENGFIAAHRKYIGAQRLYFRTWALDVWNTCPSLADWVMGRKDISRTSVIATKIDKVMRDSCSACVARLLNFNNIIGDESRRASASEIHLFLAIEYSR